MILNANTSYWLAVHAAPGQGTDSLFGYLYRVFDNATKALPAGVGASHLGYQYGYSPNYISEPRGSWLYQVDGTPIVASSSSAPEPSPLVFLTLGSTVIFLTRRRRRTNA